MQQTYHNPQIRINTQRAGKSWQFQHVLSTASESVVMQDRQHSSCGLELVAKCRASVRVDIWQVLESEASSAGTATFIGTPHYLSPEVFRGEVYDERADAWALGCVMYEMICQVRPFHQFEINVALLSLRIAQGEYDRDLLRQHSKQHAETILQMVEGLLQPKLEDRRRAADLIPLLSCRDRSQASASSAPSCWNEVPTDPEPSESAGAFAASAASRSFDSDSWHHAEIPTNMTGGGASE